MAVDAPTAAQRRGRRRPDQLTGGRHGLSVEEVRTSQRTRIVQAMTAAVGAHGYHGVRVADVVWRAGVSRKTFYELFGGKDDCFAETYGVAIDALLEATFAAFDTQEDWVDRLRAGLAALLGKLSGEPTVARLCFSEAVAVGGLTEERRQHATAELERLFDAPTTPAGPIGQTLRTGRVSELCETLRREVVAERTGRLPDLIPELMCAMVLPFLGIDAAERELARRSSTAR